jgi:hypothetical protein
LCNMIDRVWCWLTWSWMGKLVLRKTILRNMIDRVWAALLYVCRNKYYKNHTYFTVLYMFRNDHVNRLQWTQFCMTLQRFKSVLCYGGNDHTTLLAAKPFYQQNTPFLMTKAITVICLHNVYSQSPWSLHYRRMWYIDRWGNIPA